MPVRLMKMAKPVLALAVLVAAVFVAQPATAQLPEVSLGSPDGPPRLALGAGAFDITPGGQRDAGTQGVFRGEYHFGDLLWIISPFAGLDVTTKGGTYLYGGFGFDINFGPN